VAANTYGFADVLFVETMLHDLRQWHCESWMARVAEGEIVNTCGWDRGDLPSILLSDHLPRVVF
jgi:hypothetical protein